MDEQQLQRERDHLLAWLKIQEEINAELRIQLASLVLHSESLEQRIKELEHRTCELLLQRFSG